MKLKLVIAVGFFALFGLMNQPFMPVPVRITTYSLAYLPSIMASGLAYWYYDSTMEAKHTVLTTAAKSVVAWHSALSTTYCSQLAAASFWSSELEEYWNNNVNQTCVEMLPVIVAPSFVLSLLEFQVLRAIFLLYPYEVLNMNHDRLAYPLVASVPTLSGIILLIVYFDNGGLCKEQVWDLVFSKLDMVIDQKNFLFSNMNPVPIFTMLILIVEASIRLAKYWKVITETIMYAACWWNRRRNAVYPTHSDQPSPQPLHLNIYVNLYKVDPFMLVSLCYGFIHILHLLNFKTEVMINQVTFDCAMLGLPIYWVISSDDICDFIKLKYSQQKYRLGYY